MSRFLKDIEFGFTKEAFGEKNIASIIDLKNKEISGVKINDDWLVNSLQFEIFDQTLNSTTWSKVFGESSNESTNTQLGGGSNDFRLKAMIGIIDTTDETFGPFLQSLSFVYSLGAVV